MVNIDPNYSRREPRAIFVNIFIVFIIGLILFLFFDPFQKSSKEISYPELEKLINRGFITLVLIESDKLKAKRSIPFQEKTDFGFKRTYVGYIAPLQADKDEFIKKLKAKKIPYKIINPEEKFYGDLMNSLYLIFLVISIFIYLFVMKRHSKKRY